MSVTIAEILHYAADHCLDETFDSTRVRFVSGDPHLYSCNAIHAAARELMQPGLVIVSSAGHYVYAPDTVKILVRIETGLVNLGLNINSLKSFNDVPRSMRQQARYAWLKFCAMLAEEQGV